MEFTRNDGGRAAAGFKGNAGDCVTRAVAIATGLPYIDVYNALGEGSRAQRKTKRSKVKSSARNGVNTNRKWFKDYMTALGWEWIPTMTIGSGCRVHLDSNELPPGRLIVAIAKHYTAVVDGVLHDTWDCSEPRVTVFPAGALVNIPAGAVRQASGDYHYAPKRCVYGYWRQKTGNPA